jgi:putative hydrolase of the HAD superfamily
MIKNILFDIGSVLISYDREATVREYSFYSESIPQEKFCKEHVFLPGFLPALERGEITGEEYYEHFLKISGCCLSFRHFAIIWSKHFAEIEPMIDFGWHLSQLYRVFFLSDTSLLHIPALYDIFPSLLFFHGQALSFELGVMKPERAFFERALEKLGLVAEECLFIDDLEANVSSASNCGICVVRHIEPEATIAAVFRKLERRPA